ncbi:hypothetical protein [Marinomonas arctica]|uniref:Uncharacterized protein n=3 Tax=Marinomonas TaxID=28253 RepID=A0A7H1J668_9GAMM|nr:hypothetical protein [Marinomonas arctica]MCS7484971.1 hypothetical protein [Marinomonas sp. BSi20414]QNT05984.1 hypothetical protein IBG28_20515 [Marinomonas arctica]GGN19747.1 hypothetical protein GCM10011350_06390 [Marinomonas arctica]
MSRFELGFKSSELPVTLKDCSYENDTCPSFYFRMSDRYYKLWVEHKDKAQREDPDSPRYTVCKAINEGDEASPEIYTDHEAADLFKSEEAGAMIGFVREMQF